MIRSFDPIADENSKLLILGTMPGAESLRKQQYYGYDRNQFWKIMFSVFQEDFKENYDEKKKLLLENGAALWDVIKNCERENSSDSKIKRPEANDISSLHCLQNILI
ncbi:MAG: DNA-deoxyinosine glycosylase [Bacillota bacterium]|nr:DNA-deoxyinosine glycosylase [Bacillota bacterium]